MRYENRQPTEGINVSSRHPLRQFVALTAAAIVLVVLLVVLLQISGGWLGKRVPFSVELAVMEQLDIEFGNNEEHPQMVQYLNDLAQRIASQMPLDEGMQVHVHYSSQDVFNAFATIGGNLMFYKGLVERMPDENTLAMVMAHEIAHVLHRDPMASLGGGVVSTVALLSLTGNAGTGMAGSLLNSTGSVTSVQFTKAMEEAADAAALSAMQAVYGHVNGATALFDMFRQARGSDGAAAPLIEGLFSTHPLDQDRIDAVLEISREKGWRLDGALTPLPDGFAQWL